MGQAATEYNQQDYRANRQECFKTVNCKSNNSENRSRDGALLCADYRRFPIIGTNVSLKQYCHLTRVMSGKSIDQPCAEQPKLKRTSSSLSRKPGVVVVIWSICFDALTNNRGDLDDRTCPSLVWRISRSWLPSLKTQHNPHDNFKNNILTSIGFT